MKRNLILFLAAVVLIFVYLITRISNPPPVWPDNADSLAARLPRLNIPELRTEGDVLHTHQHVDINIDGQAVIIPAGIGIAPDESFIAPIHTHDTTGIIHVESPEVKDFYLGQFFDIWGIKFDGYCLNTHCLGGKDIYEIYVNGQPFKGDPRQIKLTAHEEIFIYFGVHQNRPKTTPSSYRFPPDY